MQLLNDFLRFDRRFIQFIWLWRFGHLARIYGWYLIIYWPVEILLGSLHLIGFSHFMQAVMQFGDHRRLYDEEIEQGESIFAERVNWKLVRMFPRSRIAAWKKIAFVLGYGIHSSGKLLPRILIHELTHVYQFQQVGLVYAPRALFAQASSAGYDFGQVEDHLDIIGGRASISKLNYEQQAEFLETLFAMRQNHTLPRGINSAFRNINLKL